MSDGLKLNIRDARSPHIRIEEREEGSDIDLDDIEISEEVENEIWQNIQLNREMQKLERKYSTSSMGSLAMESPIEMTPPPIKSLQDLRNNFSNLSLAGPCPDCETMERKMEKHEMQMQRIKQKFANSLSDEQHKIQRLQRELEKERLNSLRIQQKLEQDFDFHKQMVVNDCGRHIEELQEEHRESLRIIERKMSMEQKEVIFASQEFKKLKLEVCQAKKEKRDLQYENTLLKIQLKAKRAPKHIKISGEFATDNQNKSIPGIYDLDDNIVHETLEHRPVYKRRTLAQGHRIWLVYNNNNRVWNFQPTKKLFSSVSLVFIRSRAVFPTLIPPDSIHMASNGQTGWSKVNLIIEEYSESSEIIPIQFQLDSESEGESSNAEEVQL